jgi:hypothetical protein
MKVNLSRKENPVKEEPGLQVNFKITMTWEGTFPAENFVFHDGFYEYLYVPPTKDGEVDLTTDFVRWFEEKMEQLDDSIIDVMCLDTGDPDNLDIDFEVTANE